MGEFVIKNCEKRQEGDINDDNKMIKQNKPFSLFTCKKKEFKDWFDPL